MVWSGSYTTICRLCMQQDGFLLAIFNNHTAQTLTTSEHRSIQKKIAECTALELSSGDGLPPCVCHRCLYKVELCLEFRQQCLESDATLRQISGKAMMQSGDFNEDAASDRDSEDYQQSISKNFCLQAEQVLNNHNPNTHVEDVVMVVDPNMDYDSENESDLEAHTSDNENTNEHLKNVYMCKYCDKAYTSREECYVHENEAHNNEIPFKCSSCDMGFADRTNFTAHQKSVHGNDKPFGCPQCERSFSRRSDLRKHTVVHTGIKPFTCHICLKSFSRNTNLTKHLRIHSGHKPYVCPQCPKTFISKGDLTRHSIIHSGQKPFVCSYCDQSFGRRDKMLRHEKRHFPQGVVEPDGLPTEDRAVDAEDSQFTLHQELELWGSGVTGELAVKQEGPAEEEECDEDQWGGENMVISVDPFSQHSFVQDQTTEETEEELQLKKDKELPPIPEHITADSNDMTYFQQKRYPCLVCHKRFPTADSLRYHSTLLHPTESAARPHVCPLCSKAFMRKRELDRHIATHSGMKPFKCTSCDKRFGRKDKLMRHMRIHEGGQRTHQCPVCPAGFTRKDSLSHHMSTQHPSLTDMHINQ